MIDCEYLNFFLYIFQALWKKDFTLEFSRDRKSMSSYCLPVKQTKLGPGPKMFVKGAPEGVLDRCAFVRVGSQKVPMTPALKAEISKHCRYYGTGKYHTQTRVTIKGVGMDWGVLGWG